MAVSTNLTYNATGGYGSGIGGSISSSGNSDITFEQTIRVTNSDGLTNLIKLDPAKSSSNFGKGVFMLVHNVTEQPVEIQIVLNAFDNSDDEIRGGDPYNHVLCFILNGGEYMHLPTTQMFTYDTNTDQSNPFSATLQSAGKKYELTSFTSPAEAGNVQPYNHSGSATDTSVEINGSGMGSDTTVTTLVLDSGDTYFFKKYDLIRVENEIMQVTADVSSNTDITVARGVAGSTAATHADDSHVEFYFQNKYTDDNINSSDTEVFTDEKGSYMTTNFFGYGRQNGTGGQSYPQGIVPGSVAIKFSEGGFTRLGMRDVHPSRSSGLAKNTAYAFNITLSGTSFASISFTTDKNDVTWGNKGAKSTGVLRKIQDAIDSTYSSNVRCHASVDIVNGDIQFTNLHNHTGANCVLAAPTSGTTPWGVGDIPAVTTFDTENQIAPSYPEDDDYSSIMFDDGHGNLNRAAGGSGWINYETGTMRFEGCPILGEFKFLACFNSALSGYQRSGRKNTIASVNARSLNSIREAYVKICVVDDFIDDSTVENFAITSGGGTRASSTKMNPGWSDGTTHGGGSGT
tara:strand:+ start:2871 stop:4586 length:1716 start_codon:yes stop_codon:yes gene_type:complete